MAFWGPLGLLRSWYMMEAPPVIALSLVGAGVIHSAVTDFKVFGGDTPKTPDPKPPVHDWNSKTVVFAAAGSSRE